MNKFFRILGVPQRFVDQIGMYRMVSGGLGILALFSISAGGVGWLSYGAFDQVCALALALATALLVNVGIAFITKIPANHESAVVTALILFFLVMPGETPFENWPLLLAVCIAIFSKFVLVHKKQHVVNPAAFGAGVLSVTGVYVFSWWVSNPVLFIPLLIIGSLVVMKVRKWAPVLTFLAVGGAVFLTESVLFGESLSASFKLFFVSWPTLFFACFMLTEPFTMPSTKRMQIVYGAFVGFIANTTLFSPVISITPELALIIGNVCAIPFRLNQKLFFTLLSTNKIAQDTIEFVFERPKGFHFVSGQYLEWMLPHAKRDKRGIRRYFTIASAPTEPDVRIALKIPEKASSFKTALSTLKPGQQIIGSQLAGDFTLPPHNEKIGCIAGGIGITPFRSHLRTMIDTKKAHDTVLYYCANTRGEIAYGELCDLATKVLPVTIIQVIAREEVPPPLEHGFITAEMIQRRTPDYRDRIWYLSGPPIMVTNYSALLRTLGVPRTNIRKDFFPGAV